MNQWIKWDTTKRFFYNATTVGASGCRRNVDWNLLYSQKIDVPCPEEQEKIVAKYKVGDVVNGKISGVVSFGAFVDFDDASIRVRSAVKTDYETV
jgi:hypothetical protein